MAQGTHRAEIVPSRGGVRAVMLLSSMALVGVLAAAGAATPTAVVYVSMSGSDSGSGAATSPLRTIGAAVAKTPAGGEVVVAAGSYHETITLSGRSSRTITAAPGATVWLDGSRAVTGWTASGSTWVSDGWTAQFDSSPTFTSGAPDGPAPYFQFVNPAYPMAAHPDQVWVDGAALTQVASRAQVTSGTFFVDDAADQLVIGSDPTGHTVTASDLAKAISVREPGDTISGINVRNYATSLPLIATVTLESNGDTFSNAQVVDNASTGLYAGGTGNRVMNTTLSRNGLLGLIANGATSLTLGSDTVSQNNTQHFNMAPSAGGAKITRSTHVVVRNSTFSQNNGTGLWFDLQDYDMRMLGNRFIDNANNGLFLEVSGTGTVANNVVSGNAGDGVKVNDTDRVQIWNNTVAGNERGIDVVQDDRDRSTPTSAKRGLPMSLRSQRIQVHNNVLGRPGSRQDCELCVEDYTHRFSARSLHLRINGNIYQRPSGGRSRWLVVWSRGKGNPAAFRTLARFRAASHQERRGRVLGRVANLRRGPQWVVNHTAVPIPGFIAAQVGASPGKRHLGAWI